MSIENLETHLLEHYGLVSATVRHLGIVEMIDEKIPIKKHLDGITYGTAVLSMIINALGFVERRLYMTSDFFEKNDPMLLGEKVDPCQLNDGKLGRALDAIFEYGPTKLFGEIAFAIALKYKLSTKYRHLDTTSISVEGIYEESLIDKIQKEITPLDEVEVKRRNLRSETEIDDFKITYGHSKNKRVDLKQFVVSLICAGKVKMPLFFEALSGNNSDKISFHETIKKVNKFTEELLEKTDDSIWVADAALYAKKTLLSKENNIRWLTRVPQTIKEVKDYIRQEDSSYDWKEVSKGYRGISLQSNYGNVTQKWLLVSSDAAVKKERKTFERNFSKKEEILKKKIKKIQNKLFENEKEYNNELEDLRKKNPLFVITLETSSPAYKNKDNKVGRANQDGKVIKGHYISVTYSKNEEAIKLERNACGRFILATNDLENLSDETMLREYKNQSKVESGFRFLKHPSFFADDVYLKKPGRIQALMMIMALTLLVYTLSEYHMRESLVSSNQTFSNQKKKQIQNPTSRLVFSRFRGVTTVEYYDKEKEETIYEVTRLNKDLIKVIDFFGEAARRIYRLTGPPTSAFKGLYVG